MMCSTLSVVAAKLEAKQHSAVSVDARAKQVVKSQ